MTNNRKTRVACPEYDGDGEQKDFQAECDCGWKDRWVDTKLEAEARAVLHANGAHKGEKV